MKIDDLGLATGKIQTKLFGKTTLYASKGEQVMRNSASAKTLNSSLVQIDQRIRWANIAGIFRIASPAIREGYGDLTSKESLYNGFMRKNLAASRAYGITRQQKKARATIVAPYQMTSGNVLPVIGCTMDTGQPVSDLSLGGLSIKGTTTVAELSQVLIDNNSGWANGDKLTSIRVYQHAAKGMPVAELAYDAMTLNTSDNTTLSATGLLFCSAGGYLAVDDHFIGGACFVHSVKQTDGSFDVTDQSLTCYNEDVLSVFVSVEKMREAASSYGYTFVDGVVLDPEKETDRLIELAPTYGIETKGDQKQHVDLKINITSASYAGKAYLADLKAGEIDLAASNQLRLSASGLTELDTSKLVVKVNGTACTNPTISGATLTVTLPQTVDGEQLESIVVTDTVHSGKIEFA